MFSELCGLIFIPAMLGHLRDSCKRFCFKCLGSLSILFWLMSEDFIFEKLGKGTLTFKM